MFVEEQACNCCLKGGVAAICIGGDNECRNVSFVMVESEKRGLRDLLLLDGVCWVGFSGSCCWMVVQTYRITALASCEITIERAIITIRKVKDAIGILSLDMIYDNIL